LLTFVARRRLDIDRLIKPPDVRLEGTRSTITRTIGQQDDVSPHDAPQRNWVCPNEMLSLSTQPEKRYLVVHIFTPFRAKKTAAVTRGRFSLVENQ
jgi:hypothetical protein